MTHTRVAICNVCVGPAAVAVCCSVMKQVTELATYQSTPQATFSHQKVLSQLQPSIRYVCSFLLRLFKQISGCRWWAYAGSRRKHVSEQLFKFFRRMQIFQAGVNRMMFVITRPGPRVRCLLHFWLSVEDAASVCNPVSCWHFDVRFCHANSRKASCCIQLCHP